MTEHPQDTPGEAAVRLVRTALLCLNQGGVASLRKAANEAMADLPRAQRLSLVTHLAWIAAAFAARTAAAEREVMLEQLTAANTLKRILDLNEKEVRRWPST